MFKSNSILLAACGGAVAMTAILSGAGVGMLRASTVTFSDSFNRTATTAATDSTNPNPIGNGWVISPDSAASTWKITTSPVAGGGNVLKATDAADVVPSNDNPILMVNSGAETPATGGFTVSVDFATPVATNNQFYPGFALNYQNASNYYYVRVLTGIGGTIQMFDVKNGGNAVYFNNTSTALASALTDNTFYNLTATSTTPGQFTFTVSTLGSSPTTLITASASSSLFTGGEAGIIQQANTGNYDYFSNFSDTFTPVPEPASLGLVAVGALGLMLLKRRKASA
ncbi:MAG: PEP-CTERM sorting domain-containing protein [Phycisphaerae bacterium]